ncbi:MAG TPA: hypothetical protein VML57_13170, partial [Burkholderiales bacterium]|nr:hypothetical protein [Burkholderiales bacterium]
TKEAIMFATKKLAAALAASALSLSGCYIVPVGPDGNPMVYLPIEPAPIPNQAVGGASRPAIPAVLHARLYPANDLATQTGMVSGTVTNMMTGKGRFQLHYNGELLAGEATRVSGDERKGVASAYGASGSFMSCEYQMSSPYQGAGLCGFSNGAKYQVHIGR